MSVDTTNQCYPFVKEKGIAAVTSDCDGAQANLETNVVRSGATYVRGNFPREASKSNRMMQKLFYE